LGWPTLKGATLRSIIAALIKVLRLIKSQQFTIYRYQQALQEGHYVFNMFSRAGTVVGGKVMMFESGPLVLTLLLNCALNGD
jgi:hypothetical protein